MGTKVTLTKVYPLLNRVIYRLQIRDDDGQILTPDKFIKSSLLNIIFPAPSITVQQELDSNTITITARSPDPQQAMFLSNTLAEAYIEDSEAERKKETQSARLIIDGQMVKVKEDYNNALKDILVFKDKQNTVNLEIETKIAIEKIAEPPARARTCSAAPSPM